MSEVTSTNGEASTRTPPQSAGPSVESEPLLSSENSNNSFSNRRLQQSTSRIEEQVDKMIHSISDHVTTFRRVHLLDGWNVETSPHKMKDIILLGLRVGFCGALSTFSSLNASVIRLLRAGSVGEALVTIILSIQLGIVSYRFGQHLAVYIFVWRLVKSLSQDTVLFHFQTMNLTRELS